MGKLTKTGRRILVRSASGVNELITVHALGVVAVFFPLEAEDGELQLFQSKCSVWDEV